MVVAVRVLARCDCWESSLFVGGESSLIVARLVARSVEKVLEENTIWMVC